MTHLRYVAGLVGLLALASPSVAQEPKPLAQTTPAGKINDVPKDGLVIAGKLTEDDPPLAGAPIAKLNGAPHQVYHVRLMKGQSYVIDLVSADFDAYLILQNALGTVRAHDDDSGGGLNSRIVYEAPADGVYRLVAAALDRKPGRFELRIRDGGLSAEEKLANEAIKLNLDGLQLDRQRKHAEGLTKLKQALAIRQELYPASKYPDGHRDLAVSLYNVGFVMKAAGSTESAVPYMEQALAIRRRLYPESKFPNGHAELADALNGLASVLADAGSYEKSIHFASEALAMRRRLYPVSKYPEGHPQIAISLNNLGFKLNAAGLNEQALLYFQQGLAMNRKLYPESRFPNGQSDLATSLNNMGYGLQAAGLLDKALPYYEQALAMDRKLYSEAKFPGGHPSLALGLNNMGFVLCGIGSHKKALPYYEQALAMNHRLYPKSAYPNGHAILANSLNNLSSVLESAGKIDEALSFREQALAMRMALLPESKYPDGHPDLGFSFNNIGVLYFRVGRPFEMSFSFLEKSLAMRRKLYPESKYPHGHPELAQSLSNLGFALHEAQLHEKALPFFEQALAMERALARQTLMSGSEADALACIANQPMNRDGLLSASAQMPDADAAYRASWDNRATVSRVQELRHAAARATGTSAADALARLKDARRRIDRLLQDSRLNVKDRDRELAGLADERDNLERQLAKDLPVLRRWEERDRLSPVDLANALPAEAAFVDLLAWKRFVQDPKVNGAAGAKRERSYTAFVVTQERKIKRIDLGLAEPIDAAIAAWRQAIAQREVIDAPDRLRRLVWDPIARQLPAGIKTLYISSDGDLARVPWAALPVPRSPGIPGEGLGIRAGRVLLEDYAVAAVPHGLFLLEALQSPRKYSGQGSLLTLGDVAYNAPAWPALTGTGVEIRALGALAASPPVVLTKADATAARLAKALPKARYAHLATHGEFKETDFAAERKRHVEMMHQWQEGAGDLRRLAAKNPLAYVGLVLADGEVLTGLSILDVDLRDMKLITLSACETGLGQFTGAKGVENLQQAFHLAGCENVVASLWKVNDAATAALMAKFYHEMWANKKPPIESLREAQLTIYRHPELIPDLAGERGAPRLKEAVAVRAGVPATGDRKHADTKLWAAFVLSGVGR